MNIDISKFRGAFFEEAEDHLATMEATLIELEANPSDPEPVQRIFRAAHSLKGASGTFGFADIAKLTHHLEELLDELRENKLQMSHALAGLLLRCSDALRGLLDASKAESAAPPYEHLIAEIAAARAAHAVAPVAAAAPAPEPEAPKGPALRDVDVTYVPAEDSLRMGMDPLLVVRDLADLGEVVERSADTASLPAIEEMDPESCYLGFKVKLRTAKSDADIRDVFAFVEDSAKIEISSGAPAAAPSPALAIAPPRPSADVSIQRMQDQLDRLPPADAHPDAGKSPVPPAGAVHSMAPGARPKEAAKGAAAGSTLRVATDKVDRLVDLVGEVMIAQAMVAQAMNDPSPTGVERLREAMNQMERNTRELQERVMAVRMVPVGTVFARFPRLVRDLAASLGKKINLELSGEDIELDKGMIEQLADPLTHIVRNSIDHGIEMPDDRRAAGKNETGTLHLSAQHIGGSVVIEVSDDGRGLQTQKIRAKALKNGLIREDDPLSEDEINALVFHAGFSTAETVTSVSGRGVGMDVVKRNVEAMNGTVGMSSRQGLGSTARIRLPLTLAVMDGLSLRVGEQIFVLPLISIRESFRPKANQVKTLFGRGEMMMIRGESIPLVRIHDLFGIPDGIKDPSQALVCIVDSGTSRVGLMVDEPLGQSQVVVKSLDTHYRKVEGVMGATIMGDGRVALILDATAISRQAGRVNNTKESRNGSDVRAA